MAVDRSVIGKTTGMSKVTVERGAVSAFAAALTDDNEIYRDRAAARAAGFDQVPAPPTYTFGMRHSGAYADEQPPDPTGGVNPMHTIMGELHAQGALVLHGEQEFEYHRPVEVGDVLTGESRIVDVYEKDTDAATMTFIVMATEWQDEGGTPVVTERFNLIARLKK